MRPLLTQILLTLLLATSAHANIDVRSEPAEPTFLDSFTITVTATVFLHSTVELGSVSRVGQTLSIQLIQDDGGGIIGIPILRDYEFDVPFEALPAGNYAIEIRDRDMALIETFPLVIGDVENHPLEPNLTTHPVAPNDNQSVQLLVPVLVETCRFDTPVVASLDRRGHDFEVHLEADVAVACSPGGGQTRSDVLVEQLGQLEAGDYRVIAYLTEVDEGVASAPILVGYREFTVADDADRALLQNQRFRVSATWQDFEGTTGVASPVPGASEESTLFTFFGQDNWELMVKVLDACAINDRFWILGAAATNVAYDLTITDTMTGEEWTFSNPLGELSPAFADTEAFADSCSP